MPDDRFKSEYMIDPAPQATALLAAEAARDRFRVEQGDARERLRKVTAERDEAVRLGVEALLRYGRHDDEYGGGGAPTCASEDDGPGTCDCGFDAALARLRELLPGRQAATGGGAP